MRLAAACGDPEVRLQRLPHAQGMQLPARASEGSAGIDLSAAVQSALVLAPGERALVPTGFVWEIPEGYEGQVRPRSGLALKNGVTCLNAPGTVDCDYRGEVCVILINHGREPFVIERGMRVAQMVLAPVAAARIAEAPSLTETARASGGFGHTGS